MPLPAARRRSKLSLARAWAKKNPFAVWVAMVTLGTVFAWACAYAPPAGFAAALCQLRAMLTARLGAAITQLVPRPPA